MTKINREPLLDNKIAIFIDSNVDDYQQLIQNIITPAQVFILDSSQDGVEQISQILQENPHFTKAHIVSHGAPGCLYLGNTNLSLDTLDDYTSQLQSWQAIDTLLLYGCNVAAGDAGAEFIERLHHITKAKIAASAKRTGSSALGGDWNLEITTGEVDVAIAFNEEVQKRYAGVLANIEVTNLDDSGTGSLREALETINGNNDASNTITFADALSGGTITLASELLIRNNVTIEGSGITISGNDSTRVFRVDADNDSNNSIDSTAVTLRNLTITDGQTGSGGANRGAGILNEGNLTLENVTVDGNVANTDAGGIASFGDLTLRNSTISNNSAQGTGGGIAINAGTLNIENSTISGNSATGDASGIDTRENTVTINNSTIAFNNSVGGNGSGIFAGGRNNPSAVTITSSIIAQNSGDGDLVADNGATFSGNNNIIGNGDNAGTINGTSNQVGTAASPVDPLLEALADNDGTTQTHALQENSPAIDAGAGQSADQRGVAASDGDGNGSVQIDIGAFEFASVIPEISVTGDTDPAEGTSVVNGEFGFSFSSALPQDITISFTIAGSAGNPGDYTFDQGSSSNVTNLSFDASTGTGTFTVPAGEIDATLVVIPVDDTEVDPSETIELTINSGTGYTIDGNLNAATLTIVDDDVALPTVSIVATDATATEEDATDPGVFTISRTGETTGALDVTLTLDGSVADAAANDDYSLSVGGNAVTVSNGQATITIPDGQASVTLDVTANADDDTVSEALKFDLDATAGTYTADGTDNTATVTLADNDTTPTPPTVSIEVTDDTATEGSTTDTGVFTISRTGDTTAALDVSFDIISSTQDYQLVITNQANAGLNDARNELSLTIPSGESELTITLEALEDADTDNETFTLDLVDSNNYEVGTNSSSTVNIIDNDTDPSAATVTNNAGTFTLGGAPAGEIVNLQFNLVSKNATLNNTIGVVEVDANGLVDGFAPGSDGFDDAVLREGREIFSALANTTNISVDSSSIISEFGSGADLLFYLIPDGNPSNGLLFSSETNQLDIENPNANEFTLSWDDQVGGTDKDDLVVEFSTTSQGAVLGTASQGEADVLNLADQVGQSVNVNYTISSDAAFTNTVGLYRIDDLTGSVGGVAAGDDGYAQAALNNAIGDEFSVDGQTTFNVTGSGLFGLYILQNGDPNTPIFSIPNANLGQADHTRLLGDNTFGFEDLLSTDPNFDGDFNDLVVSFDIQIAQFYLGS